MLRVVLLLLILANLLFFVWAQGLLGTQEDGREPQRLGMQIAPERLHVDVVDPSSTGLLSTAESCRLVRGLAADEAQRMRAQAEDKLPGLKVVVKVNETKSILHWVFLPPQPDRLAVDKKLAELRNLGVTNSSVMLEEGADKFAISLGLFNTAQLANEYLQELLKRGVKSAKVQMRENLLDKAQLEVRGPDDMLAKRLPELLSGHANASVVDCPNGP